MKNHDKPPWKTLLISPQKSPVCFPTHLQGGEVFQLGVTLQQQGRVLRRRHLLLAAPGHGRFSVLFVWLKISDGSQLIQIFFRVRLRIDDI